jgi:hypothetical protein
MQFGEMTPAGYILTLKNRYPYSQKINTILVSKKSDKFLPYNEAKLVHKVCLRQVIRVLNGTDC